MSVKVRAGFCQYFLNYYKYLDFCQIPSRHIGLNSRIYNNIHYLSIKSTRFLSILNMSVVIQKKHYAVYHRRPVGVTRHDYANKGKTLEEYATKQKETTASGEFLDDDLSDDIIEENEDEESTSSYNIQVDTIKPHHVKERHEGLKFINAQNYEEVKRKYRKFFENGKSAKNRYENDVFMIEGWRLCAEALKAGLEPKAIFYSRSGSLAQMGSILNKSPRELAEYLNLFPLVRTPYKKLKIWSSLTNSPGLAAAFSISDANRLTNTMGTSHLPLTIVLDEVRDPNNLGSIIRTLVAAGVQQIILMKGCCDLWDSKVLRSCCGGHFKMPFSTRIEWATLSSHLPPDSSIYIAESELPPLIVVDQVDRPVSDSGSGVAATEELVDASTKMSKSQTSYFVNEFGEKVYVNESFNDETHLEQFENINIPTSCYDEVNFYSPTDGQRDPIVLVIGGETGLSREAKKFAVENHGLKLSIPLLNDIESLNSSVATGIIAYEIARQLKKAAELSQ